MSFLTAPRTDAQKATLIKVAIGVGAVAAIGLLGWAVNRCKCNCALKRMCRAMCPFGSCCQEKQRKPKVVFVLGGPGAGKGTQCAHIVNDFGFVHLSAGDLLRDEQKKGGEVGNMIKKLIAEGQIVPVAVTLGLLKQAMQESMAKGDFKFLIDGFPRNADNLDGWNREMGTFADVAFCLVLDCPEAVMESRLLKRGETSGRADDNAASIKKRFQTFVESTKPVIEGFEAQGKVRVVSAAQSVEAVRAEVQKIFQQVQW